MTTVTLRPDGTIQDSGNTLTGGSPISTILADNSDASYATSGATGNAIGVNVGTTTLPAGARTKTINARIRSNSATATSVQLSAEASLRGDPHGIVSPVIDLGAIASDASITTRTGVSVAVEFAQANIDVIGLYLQTSNSGLNLYELYLDLVYATQPTVAVSAPTGTISTTSQPAVAWVHTPGSDGGPQAYYQVKIFSDTQYSITGFSPDTAAATFDSGSLLGNGSTATPTSLANATTYRAYVRTAQSINGGAHWSDWSFSSFTTSFTTPTITSVTVTSDSTLARQRITVTRNTGSPAWATLDLQRSVDNGTTWAPVRGATGVVPPGDVWIGYDYEASNGVAAIYRARPITTLITGPWVTSTGATWTSASTWLKDLRSTSASRIVRAQVLPSPSRGREQGVHDILGRADPIVISDVRKTIAGTISFVTATETQANDLIALSSAQVLLLQTPTSHRFGSRYIVILGDLVEKRVTRIAGEQYRVFEASFREVTAPPDAGLVVAGLTWQDIVSSYADWTTFVTAVLTWGNLV